MNSKYPNVGCSAEWYCNAWLVKGFVDNGVVITDDEDGSFSLVSFYFDNDNDDNNQHHNLFTGTFEECEQHFLENDFLL
jgi:hypothetical protein